MLDSLIPFLVGFPAVAAILVLVLSRFLALGWRLWGAIASVVLAAVTVPVFMLWGSVGAGPIYSPTLVWLPLPNFNLYFTYYVDGLNLVFATLSAAVTLAVVVHRTVSPSTDPDREPVFFASALFLVSVMLHTLLSVDLLGLYLGWEMVGLCSYGLIALYHRDLPTAKAARNMLGLFHLGGYGLLGAATLLAAGSQPSLLLTSPGPISTSVFLLLLLAAIVRANQFPMHGWTLPLLSIARTPAAIISSAGLANVALYLLARTYSLGGGSWEPRWQYAVVALGIASVVVGSFGARQAPGLREALAYSAVADFGLAFTALGVGTPEAVAAALLYAVNFSLARGALFLLLPPSIADVVPQRGRVGRIAMVVLGWMGVAALAGLPPFLGFTARWLLFTTALDAGFWAVALVGVLAGTITLVTFMRALVVVLGSGQALRVSRWMAGVLLLPSLLLSLGPGWLIRGWLEPAVTAMMPTVRPDLFDLGPLGVSVVGFGPSSRAVLALMVLSVVLALRLSGLPLRNLLAPSEAALARLGGTKGIEARLSPARALPWLVDSAFVYHRVALALQRIVSLAHLVVDHWQGRYPMTSILLLLVLMLLVFLR